MNRYEQLAQQLLQRSPVGGAPPSQGLPYDSLKKFLASAQGVHAARVAVDKLIVDKNLTGQVPPIPHQAVFETLNNVYKQSTPEPPQVSM